MVSIIYVHSHFCRRALLTNDRGSQLRHAYEAAWSQFLSAGELRSRLNNLCEVLSARRHVEVTVQGRFAYHDMLSTHLVKLVRSPAVLVCLYAYNMIIS